MIPSLKEALVKNMKEDRFGLVNNGSSDNGMKTLIDNCTYIFCIKRTKILFEAIDKKILIFTGKVASTLV